MAADKTHKNNPLNLRAGLSRQGAHNPGSQNFDLSDESFFTSNGDASLWPTDKTRVSDAVFLEKLSQAYNARPDLVSQWSGEQIVFEGGPPAGFALFRKSDLFVHGHPTGASFRSVKGFVDHVHAIMTETVASCVCKLCNP